MAALAQRNMAKGGSGSWFFQIACCSCVSFTLPAYRKREWQRIGNQINAAIILGGADFVIPTTRENAPASLKSLRFSPDQIQLHHANVVAAVAGLQIRNLEYRRRVG